MLELLIENFERLDDWTRSRVEWVLVDDCSPEPAEEVIRDTAQKDTLKHIRLFEILDDIPWNQHGARNLGAQVATSDWLQMQDMDRMVLAADQKMVVEYIQSGKMSPNHHYKARGYNMKYAIAWSEDKPIVNQFWCTREAYWDCGGYDEDYCGVYGGDGPLLRALEKQYPLKTMRDIIMFRYDRHIVPDATTLDLERKRGEYAQLAKKKMKAGNVRPKNPIRFRWREVEL